MRGVEKCECVSSEVGSRRRVLVRTVRDRLNAKKGGRLEGKRRGVEVWRGKRLREWNHIRERWLKWVALRSRAVNGGRGLCTAALV